MTMFRWRRLAVLAMAFVGMTLEAPGAALAVTTDGCTANDEGASGVWHTQDARLCARHVVTLSLPGSYGAYSKLTLPQDTYSQLQYGLRASWFIDSAWQVGLGLAGNYASLELPGHRTHRGTGAADLFAKYSRPWLPALTGALVLRLHVPGAGSAGETNGSGQVDIFAVTLTPKALTVTPELILSWRPALLDATLGVAYAFDNSASMLSGAANAEQAASLDISAGNRVLVHVAAQRLFTPASVPWFAVAPLAELSAAFPGSGAVKHSSAALTLGAKGLLGTGGWVEAAIGVDIGLAGMASTDPTTPATPAWRLFWQLAFNIERMVVVEAAASQAPPAPAAPLVRACESDAACQPNERCRDHRCGVAVFIVDPNLPIPTRVLRGRVFDANTHADIPGALIRVADAPTIITTEHTNGWFNTWPLDTRQPSYIFKASASGYLPASVTVDPNAWPDDKTLQIELTSEKDAAPLFVRGLLRDGSRGGPVAGQVFFPSTGQVVKCDAAGNFEATLKPGEHEVVISAPKHASQRRTIRGDSGESIILNIDLAPEKLSR